MSRDLCDEDNNVDDDNDNDDDCSPSVFLWQLMSWA